MKEIIISAILALAIIFGLTHLEKPQTVMPLGGLEVPALQAATTSSAISITTSARALATTTNPTDPANSYIRVFASICNANANPVALNLDADKPANGPSGRVTVWIAAAAGYDACYEITARNPYQGSITASSTNGTATIITVKDYVSQ